MAHAGIARAASPRYARSMLFRWTTATRRATLGLTTAAVVGACDRPRDGAVTQHTPRTELHDDTYGSSASCRSCHPDAYETWSATYHRTMTQRATPEAVLGDWDDIILERSGREYVLYREGDTFMVDMPRPGTRGARESDRMQRPVVMTTGSHHLQLYWIVMPWLDDAPSGRGAATAERACGSCHALPGTDLDADDPRTFLQNRKLSRPELQAMLVRVPESGPHAAPFQALAPSDLPELVDYLARIQHGDRIAQFPFAWFVRQQRWIHEDDSFLSPPEDPPEHEVITEGWSEGCDRCHAVGPDFAWDADNLTGDAGVVDLGIACEACHGAGSAHASRYRNPLGRYAAHLGLAREDDIIVPSELPADRSAQVCGQCHAELVPIEPEGDEPGFPLDFRPGDDLHAVAHFVQRTDARPDWLAAHLEDEPDAIESGFWRDGTMRIAGRDYTALLETPCHTAGELACTTCHKLHGADANDQLKPTATGDTAAGEQVCLDCHPGLDTSSHHHHPEDSAGARCMNCHMPHTTIGLLTVMRSHRVDSPSPAQAGETGRPDACTLCHLDQPLAWSAARATEWWGQPELSAGLSSPAPASFDWLLRGDAAQRAVVAWHLADDRTAVGTSWTPVYLAWSLDDPYVAVRSIVHERLRGLDGYTDLDWDPTAPPAELGPVRDAVLQRWAQQNPGLDRPDLWISSGVPHAERIERWRMLRDETPVSVNE